MVITLIKKVKKLFNFNIFVIIVLGFLSITWFRGDYMISGGDFGIPFDRIRYLRLMFYSWDETLSMGMSNPRQLASLIPYALWGGITELLGLSLVFWEKSLFYIWFAGSGLSMYYLCSVLGMKRLGKLAASIFYMMNPFSLIIIWRVSHALIQMPYAFAPLYLGLYINGIQKRKKLDYVILMCLVWLLTATSAYAWPAAAVIHWIPIAAFFVFYVLSHFRRDDRLFTLKFSLQLVVFWLLLNAYWFIPFIYSLSESFASAHLPALASDKETLGLTSVGILDALRMFGFWSQHGGYKGEYYYSYGSYHSSPTVISISFLIPFLFLFPLLSNRKSLREKSTIIFFAVLFLIGVFFVKGPYPPLGYLTSLVYEKLPYIMLMVRFVFLFFGIPAYLAGGVLFGYGILGVYKVTAGRIGRIASILIGGLFFALFYTLVLPFWTGEVIRSEGIVWPGERVKVPDYYWQFKEWSRNEKGDFRIFPFPMSKTYNVTNDWEKGYSGGDPMRWFSDKPVINVNTGESFKIPELIAREVETPSYLEGTEKLLGLTGVKYVVLRNDTNWEFIRGHSWWFNHNEKNLEEFFNLQDTINLDKQFGKLDVYAIEEGNLNPHIFAPENIIFIEGGAETLLDIVSFEDFETKGSGIFSSAVEGNDVSEALSKADSIFVQSNVSVDNEGVSNFLFNIPVEGDYEVFIRKGAFGKYFRPTSTLSIQLDQNPFEERVTREEGGLFSLGTINLNEGKHTLKTLPPDPINLIEDPSFEEGIWSGVEDASPWAEEIPDVSAELVDDATEGKSSLKLSANSHTAVVYQPLAFFEKGGIYKLSFDFKNVRGGLPRFAIWENDGELDHPIWLNDPNPLGTTAVQTTLDYEEEALEKSFAWLTHEIIFELGEYTEVAGLAFFSDAGENGKTINLFDNVKVEKVFDNPILLRFQPKADRPSAEEVEKPEVEFVRVNPTKYRVQVRGAGEAYFLVFSEAFHPEWKAFINRKQNTENRIQNGGDRFLDRNSFETWGMGAVAEEKHVIANGFANSWYIEELGDYEIILEFWPQRIFIVSLGLSSLVLVGGLIYLLKNGYKG